MRQIEPLCLLPQKLAERGPANFFTSALASQRDASLTGFMLLKIYPALDNETEA